MIQYYLDESLPLLYLFLVKVKSLFSQLLFSFSAMPQMNAIGKQTETGTQVQGVATCESPMHWVLFERRGYEIIMFHL